VRLLHQLKMKMSRKKTLYS